MPIRKAAIIRAVTAADGKFEGNASTDALTKLKRALGERAGPHKALQELVLSMSQSGELVVERAGERTRFVLIALPGAVGPTLSETSKEGTNPAVPAPRGMKLTTSPRDGSGHPLPATLSDEQVGPVEVSSVNGSNVTADAEDVELVACLVVERLCEEKKTRINRDAALALIRAVICELYDQDQPDMAESLLTDVLGRLVDTGRLIRVTDSGRDAVIYAFRAPNRNPPPSTKDEALAQLIRICEGLQAHVEELESQLAGAANLAVIEDLTTRLEAAHTTIGDQRKELREAQEVNWDLELQISAMARAHEQALAELRAELENVKSKPPPEVIPADLRARLEKLGVTPGK